MKIIYLLILSLLFSCSKENEIKCGEEVNSVFTIHNYSEFSKSRNKWIINGNDSMITFTNKSYPDQVLWGLEIHLKNICNSDMPHLEYSLSVLNPYPPFFGSAIAFFGEYNEYVGRQHIGLPSNGKNSNYNIDYSFKNRNYESAILKAYMYIKLPEQGSFSADSAFFFSNLDSMSIKITAHKPQWTA